MSLQSLGAIIFGLMLSRRSVSLQKQPGVQSAHKFLYAMFCMTAAFGVIALVCNMDTSTALFSPLLFIPVYLMISLAELLLYPVGLSAVTVLAPRKRVSTMMGIFFVSLGVGGFLSGKLADLAAIASPQEASITILKAHYATAFGRIFLLLLGLLIVCGILNRIIVYLLKDSPQKSCI